MISPRREDVVRILLAGGGSGGHVYPGLAIAGELHRAAGPRVDVRFLATTREVDRRILGDSAVDWEGLPELARGRDRLGALARAPGTLLGAVRRVRAFRPDAIIGLGGRGSIPAVLAGAMHDVPIYLVEPNVTPGRANRFLARYAREVWVQFEASSGMLGRTRVFRTGNPIRRLRRLDRGAARRRLGLEPEGSVLLVLGGSQGASALNGLAGTLAGRCARTGAQVVHATGGGDSTRAVAARYRSARARAVVRDYLDPIDEAYAAADAVICRAGAGTLAEVACFGLPAVLLPYRGDRARHQVHNAEFVRERGAALVEDEEDTEAVGGAVDRLLGDRGLRARMARRAAALGRPGAAAEAVARLRDWGVLP